MRQHLRIDLENINPDELEALTEQLNESESTLTDQKETLEKTGTVSKDQANEFKDDLPEGVALESFTELPTRTNYRIALESLNHAIAIVAIAGILALGAGIIMMMRRIKGAKLTKLDPKVVKVDAHKAFESAVQRQTPELRAEAFKRITDAGINKLTYQLLFGDKVAVTEQLTKSMAHMNLDSAEKMLDLYVIKDLEYLSDHKDLTDVSKLPSKGLSPSKLVDVMVATTGIDIGAVDEKTKSGEDLRRAYTEEYLGAANVTSADQDRFVKSGKVTNFEYRDLAKVNQIAADVEKFCAERLAVSVAVMEQLDKVEGLDKEVVAHIRDNLRELRRMLEALYTYVWVADEMAKAGNRAHGIKVKLLGALAGGKSNGDHEHR